MNIGKNEVEFEIENEELTYQIQISNTDISNLDVLKLINTKRDYFVEMQYDIVDDYLTFKVDISNYKLFKNLSLTKQSRYRLAYSMLKFLDLEDSTLIPLINPENILVDANYAPYLVHRGINNYLEPSYYDYEDVLLQVKALLISIIDPSEKYETVYNLQASTNMNSEVKKNIAQAINKQELEEIIIELIQAQEQDDFKSNVVVKKSRYSFYKMAFFIFLLSTILFVGVSVYSNIVQIPKLNDYLKASDKYVNRDYSSVIDILSKYNIEELEREQKQILAIASINVLELSAKQKANILNTINASSEEALLNVWALLGVGEYKAALDEVVKVDNLDLKLFALVRYKDTIAHDTTLSGEQIAQELGKVEKDIEELLTKIEEAN